MVSLALHLIAGAALAAPFDDSSLSVEAHSLAMPSDATFGGGAMLQSDGMAFLGADARAQASGDWTGRVTAGVNVLPGWDHLDLTLGLALAGVGDWREGSIYGSPGLGFDFGVAAHLGRLHGSYRSVAGRDETPVGRGLSEHRWRLGFDILKDEFQIFGQSLVVYSDVEQTEMNHAYGVGAQFTF